MASNSKPDAAARLLPANASEWPGGRKEALGAGKWIAAEAKRMKDAGEIPPGIRTTKFAQELERRMRDAAAIDDSIRPIGWRSINNRLREWGVWPIASIK